MPSLLKTRCELPDVYNADELGIKDMRPDIRSKILHYALEHWVAKSTLSPNTLRRLCMAAGVIPPQEAKSEHHTRLYGLIKDYFVTLFVPGKDLPAHKEAVEGGFEYSGRTKWNPNAVPLL